MSVTGLVLAAIGELSALSLIVPGALFLIPLARFPGFIWLMIAGFTLANSRMRVRTANPVRSSSEPTAAPAS